MEQFLRVLSFGLGSTTSKIDPLFEVAIDHFKMDSDHMYDAISTVHNTWGLLIVLWITITAPAMMTIPVYILEASSDIETAYNILAGISTISSITALYITVNTIITLAVVPKDMIIKWLSYMGSSVRMPVMLFSVSMASYLGLLFCCCYCIGGQTPNNPASAVLLTFLASSIPVAFYYGHLKNDNVLIRMKNVTERSCGK